MPYSCVLFFSLLWQKGYFYVFCPYNSPVFIHYLLMSNKIEGMDVGGLFKRQGFPISACISNSLSKYFSHKSKRDKPKVNNMTIDRNSELNMTLKSGWTIF